MSNELTNGIAVLRVALRGRARGGYLQILSRETGVSLSAIENFAYSRGELPTTGLQAITRELWNNIRKYVPETDTIVPTNANIATPVNHYAPGWSRPGPTRPCATNCG